MFAITQYTSRVNSPRRYPTCGDPTTFILPNTFYSPQFPQAHDLRLTRMNRQQINMKAVIQTLITFILMMTFFTLLTKAQESDPVKQAHSANRAKAEKNMVDKKVAEFLVRAADARLMDTREGKLAIHKGTTKTIQQYGWTMVKDQALLLEKIRVLADSRNISLPVTISDEKQDGYDKLAEKEGKEFNDKFIKMMVLDHKRDVRLFENATDLNDPEITDFAKSFLPMIQEHLDTINRIKEANNK